MAAKRKIAKAKKQKRDVEKTYTHKQIAAKLRRLAKGLETGQPFRIQIAGERIYVPKGTIVSLEHERDSEDEEIEFQMKWEIQKT